MKIFIAFVLALIVCVVQVHAEPSPLTTGLSLGAYATPGQLVRLPSGRRLNVRCIGHGSPTIILTAGAGEQSFTWRALQTKLATRNRVCAWDRPGFGFSDPSSAPMDTSRLTDDLQAALASAAPQPPYILVGHSLGSFETLMYAFRHPRNVAGIVLIDPAGPYQDARFKRAAPAAYAAIAPFEQQQLDGVRQCIRVLSTGKANADCVTAPVKGYPAALNRALIRIDESVAGKRDYLSLLANNASEADSRELMKAWHPLGSIPVIVLTAGNPPPIPVTGKAKAQMPEIQAAWSRMHDEMAHLSTRGINRRVANSGHYIYQDQPRAVYKAIEDVVSTARTT